jgi:hypothetical protein
MTRKSIGVGIVIAMFSMVMSACNITEPEALRSDGKSAEVQEWKGTKRGVVEYPFSWTDCDGNVINGTVTLHWNHYKYPVDTNGVQQHANWIGHGKGTSADGTNFTFIDNGNFQTFVTVSECLEQEHGTRRILVTQQGGGRTYWLTYQVIITRNTCTGEVTMEFDNVKAECE